MVDSTLHHKHSLWPTKATKGRIGRQICFAGMCRNKHMFNTIRICGMKQGTLHNSRRQVGRCSPVLVKRSLISHNLIVFIQSNFIIAAIWISFARYPHVLHPMRDAFGRLFQHIGHQRRHRTEGRCLVFFTTKATTQSGHIYLNLVHSHAQNPCNSPLYSRRPLCGRINLYTTMLGWIGISALRFEV